MRVGLNTIKSIANLYLISFVVQLVDLSVDVVNDVVIHNSLQILQARMVANGKETCHPLPM